MQRAFRYYSTITTTFAILFTAGLLLASLRAAAPSVQSNAWSATGAMVQSRAGAAAALLLDGSVLVTGGVDEAGVTPTAVRYSPDSASFSTTGAMQTARVGHTATLLPDGRVLVTGGSASVGGPALNTAEIYDPSNGEWATAGPMHEARSGHSATVLDEGRILFAGGDDGGTPTASLEIFDPATESFSAAAPLASARTHHAAAALLNGTVMIVGGFNGVGLLASTEIYDPKSDAVYGGPTLATARAAHTATSLVTGGVVVAGGVGAAGDLDSAELFSPVTGEFVSTSNALAVPRQSHLALLLPHNNHVLIIGGTTNGVAAATAELYTPWEGTAGTFSVANTPAAAHSFGFGAGLSFPASQTFRSGPNDGLALVGGGNGVTGAELYGFATVKTDKDDYAPGTQVIITGSGWQPNEVVHLTMIEEGPYTDMHQEILATADGQGNFINGDFAPDEHDIGIKFYLTATGTQSQAQTVFTDAPDGTFTVTPDPVYVNSTTQFTLKVKSKNGNASANNNDNVIRVVFTLTDFSGVSIVGTPTTDVHALHTFTTSVASNVVTVNIAGTASPQLHKDETLTVVVNATAPPTSGKSGWTAVLTSAKTPTPDTKSLKQDVQVDAATPDFDFKVTSPNPATITAGTTKPFTMTLKGKEGDAANPSVANIKKADITLTDFTVPGGATATVTTDVHAHTFTGTFAGNVLLVSSVVPADQLHKNETMTVVIDPPGVTAPLTNGKSSWAAKAYNANTPQDTKDKTADVTVQTTIDYTFNAAPATVNASSSSAFNLTLKNNVGTPTGSDIGNLKSAVLTLTDFVVNTVNASVTTDKGHGHTFTASKTGPNEVTVAPGVGDELHTGETMTINVTSATAPLLDGKSTWTSVAKNNNSPQDSLLETKDITVDSGLNVDFMVTSPTTVATSSTHDFTMTLKGKSGNASATNANNVKKADITLTDFTPTASPTVGVTSSLPAHLHTFSTSVVGNVVNVTVTGPAGNAELHNGETLTITLDSATSPDTDGARAWVARAYNRDLLGAIDDSDNVTVDSGLNFDFQVAPTTVATNSTNAFSLTVKNKNKNASATGHDVNNVTAVDFTLTDFTSPAVALAVATDLGHTHAFTASVVGGLIKVVPGAPGGISDELHLNETMTVSVTGATAPGTSGDRLWSALAYNADTPTGTELKTKKVTVENVPFTAAISPTVVGGGASTNFSMTLTNGAGSEEKAKQVKITIPAGFGTPSSVVANSSAVGACAAATWVADGTLISGGKINLKAPGGGGNELCAGGTLAVTFTSVAPSPVSATSYQWTAEMFRDALAFSITGPQPTVTVDVGAPTINCTVPDQSVWYGANQTVNCTASDASGLQDPGDASFSLSTSLAAGSESASASTGSNEVCDTVGNCATAGPYTFKVDLKAPQQSSCDAADATWHNTEVTLQCHYGDGGSGPLTIDVDLTTSVGAGFENANAPASAGGAQACDAVGNCAASPSDISGNMVDRKAPVVTCGAADGVWHNSDVSIACTATDGGSGLASVADASFNLTTSVTAGTEDANASTNSHAVADNVGNSATGGPVTGNKVDKKAPQLTSCDTADGLWHAANVTLQCHYLDGGSGPATINVNLTTNVAAGAENSNASASAGGAQACDAVSNCAASPADITGNKIDRKGPSITWNGGPAPGASYGFGLVPAAPTCTAADAGSGPAGCTVTGYSTAVGPHTMTADGVDNVGNHTLVYRSYTVVPYTLNGFYQPVDMGGVYNTVKGGSTVPLKFEIFAGSTEITTVSTIQSFVVTQVVCAGGAPIDDIELITTGGTVLRYDGGGGQFIQNWKTPTGAGSCYKVTMTTIDSSSITAFFKMK